LAVLRRARFSLVTALVAASIVAAPTAALILGSELPPPTPPPAASGSDYWDLPTGSEIAFEFVPAAAGTQASGDGNPIVFLHDFGHLVREADIAFFRQFSDAGFDVYLYDQAGSGRSGWLEAIGAYTIDRHVRDLEAVRRVIRADRLILIGHAGGAELAARYMVTHPDRVERAVFYGPTPLWHDDQFAFEEGRTAASPVQALVTLNLPARMTVPPAVADAVAAYSPRTAQAYVPQASMVTWSDQVVDLGRLVCFGEDPPAVQASGHNRYAGTVARVSANRGRDPRPALGQLVIPTLLLRGTCDPVEETVIGQYENALPTMRTVLIEGAGSAPHLTRPDAVWEVLAAFLE
jgi:pimeloyl-ACP methyl ester carboxylesterase